MIIMKNTELGRYIGWNVLLSQRTIGPQEAEYFLNSGINIGITR